MPKFKPIGTHILADLYDCDFSLIIECTSAEIQERISKIVLNNGLTELGNYYHFFQVPTSFTAVISLAESHISVHTWPEDNYVSIDVFVCNYGSDQSSCAEGICKELIKLFDPVKHRKKTIKRHRVD